MGERPADAGAGQGADAVVHRAPRRRTTRRSERSWSCTRTRRTTRSSPTPTATSRTSTPTSSRSATRSSTGRKPVDGSDPATDWKGLLSVDEAPNVLNPDERLAVQHQQLAVDGGGSEQPEAGGLSRATSNATTENPRGVHAITRARETRRTSRSSRSIAAAYDSYLPGFEKPMPALIKAYDQRRRQSAERKLADQIAILRKWDFRWAANSVATTLARVLGRGPVDACDRRRPTRERLGVRVHGVQGHAPAAPRVARGGVDKLTADFGTWQTPWGEINRFQRLTSNIVHPFDDAGASIPVPFTSARWGSAGPSVSGKPCPRLSTPGGVRRARSSRRRPWCRTPASWRREALSRASA